MTEEWRDIPGYEGIYQASDHGRVRRLTHRGRYGHLPLGTPRLLRLKKDKGTGYFCVDLSKNGKSQTVRVHRAVLLAFKGSPPTPRHCVAHLDNNRTNNHLSNLAWATYSENNSMKVLHCAAGLSPHPWRPLTSLSQHRGVSQCKGGSGRWVVKLCRGGKHIHGGYFATEAEAAAAYVKLRDAYDSSLLAKAEEKLK